MKQGVVILGHGSKAPEALKTLERATDFVARRLEDRVVAHASLQFNEPTIYQAVDSLVERGVKKITVAPLFLYLGNHLKEDIPAAIEEIKGKYHDLEFTFSKSIGDDMRIADIVLDNLGEVDEPADFRAHIQRPVDIEEESFRQIGMALAPLGLQSPEKEVVERIVHATGDISLAQDITWSPGAVAAGVEALRRGAEVLVDVRMVRSGINARILEKLGCALSCCLDEANIGAEAERQGITRSAAGMRLAAPRAEGGIIAIGNAPTALFEVCRLVEEGRIKPALMVGVPVGFVGAAESKQYLASLDVPFVTIEGTRGGSALAVAAVNAMLKLAISN